MDTTLSQVEHNQLLTKISIYDRKYKIKCERISECVGRVDSTHMLKFRMHLDILRYRYVFDFHKSAMGTNSSLYAISYTTQFNATLSPERKPQDEAALQYET